MSHHDPDTDDVVGDLDGEESTVEVDLTEAGTDWGDDTLDDVEAPSGDSSDRVATFFDGLPRTGVRPALLDDLDEPGAAAFATQWDSVASGERRDIARQLSSAAVEHPEIDLDAVLAAIARDSDASARQYAVLGLAASESPDALQALVTALEADESADVRAAAASALAPFAVRAAEGDDVGIDADDLRDVLETVVHDEDQPDFVRQRALESIGVFGSRGATGYSSDIAEDIAEFHDSGDTALQASAIMAMGASLDRRWLSIIERSLESDDAELRLAAVTAASGLGDQTLVPGVAQLALDEDEDVRAAAIIALGELGGRGSVLALRELASDTERDDQDAIEDALQQALMSVGSA